MILEIPHFGNCFTHLASWKLFFSGWHFFSRSPYFPTLNILQSLPQFFLLVQSVQSLSFVLLLATPHTAAHQASLSFTHSQSLLKLMSIRSVMPSNHRILCHPLLLLSSVFPSIRAFSSESVLHHQRAKVLKLQHQSFQWIFRVDFIYDWLFGMTSLQSKGLSRVFSNTTIQKHQFSIQPSLWSNSHLCAWLLEKP